MGANDAVIGVRLTDLERKVERVRQIIESLEGADVTVRTLRTPDAALVGRRADGIITSV